MSGMPSLDQVEKSSCSFSTFSLSLEDGGIDSVVRRGVYVEYADMVARGVVEEGQF
jgi:hypothetical protein